MKQRIKTCLLAATCAAGCTSTDTATEADYDDVAQALTAVVVTDNDGGEVGAMVDAAMIASGDGNLSLKLAASGQYTGSHLGLDYTYSVTCSDAEGAKQEACDDTTDSAQVGVRWSGDLALPNLTAAVSREGDWQLSDIQSAEITLTGDSNLELDAELQSLFRSVTRSYHLSYDASYEDVVLQRSTRKLDSGRVTYNIDADRTASGPRRDSEAHFTMDAVLEFTGDGQATLTLDRKFQYNIDLATAELTKE